MRIVTANNKVILSKSDWISIGEKANWLYVEAKFGDSVRKKYLEQGVEESIIDNYIKDFDKIRKQKPKELFQEEFPNNPTFNIRKDLRTNIEVYKNFKDLEFIVDYVKGQRKIDNNSKVSEANEEANVVHKDNSLEIMRADNAQQAIDAKGDCNASWCVSASGSNNLFNSYKYDKYGVEPTFYFVKDLEINSDNPNSFIVVQVTNRGNYIVTNKDNDGEQEMSWEGLIKIQPKLENKQKVLKYIPIPKETKERLRSYNSISEQEFVSLPYEQKKEYIEYRGISGLSDLQFESLPKDLKNQYISTGLGLTDNQFESVKSDKKLMDRYEEMWFRKIADNPFDYKYCPEEFKNRDKIKEIGFNGFIDAITKYPHNYNHCPEEFKNHPKIQEAYLNGWINRITKYPNFYNNCPEEFKNHPKIQEAHLDINGWINIIDKYSFVYEDCPEEFKNNPKIQEAYLNGWINEITKDTYCYHNCPEEFKNHPKILEILPENWKPPKDNVEQVESKSNKRNIWSSSFNDNYIGKIS
jgi:hypothetical protein